MSTSKVWHPRFGQNRPVPDRSFVSSLRENAIEIDVLDALLEYSKVGGISWEVEQARAFLSQPTSQKDARVWVECRAQADPSSTSDDEQHESRWLTERHFSLTIPPPVSACLLLRQSKLTHAEDSTFRSY